MTDPIQCEPSPELIADMEKAIRGDFDAFLRVLESNVHGMYHMAEMLSEKEPERTDRQAVALMLLSFMKGIHAIQDTKARQTSTTH